MKSFNLGLIICLRFSCIYTSDTSEDIDALRICQKNKINLVAVLEKARDDIEVADQLSPDKQNAMKLRIANRCWQGLLTLNKHNSNKFSLNFKKDKHLSVDEELIKYHNELTKCFQRTEIEILAWNDLMAVDISESDVSSSEYASDSN